MSEINHGFFSGEEIATTTCTNCLGDLCRKSGWNIDVGNTEEKAYSCLFQHDGFRPTKTSEITPRLSFFHTLPWLLTHPQNINICEKPLSLWRNLGTSLNRNISMCKNARPLRGAHTMFLGAWHVLNIALHCFALRHTTFQSFRRHATAWSQMKPSGMHSAGGLNPREGRQWIELSNPRDPKTSSTW
jgi:hypothetical protein